MIRSIFLVAALLMAGTASAQVARDTVVGVSRSSMIWAGPDDIYPRVAHVRAGDRVWLHGCLRHHAWCDITMVNGTYRVRGWMPGHALFIPWQGHNYSLISHGIWQQFPMSNFVLSVYWGRHYSQLPWYHDRNRFDRHDWRRDQWRWDRYSRNDNERDLAREREENRQRVIDERREALERQSSGRDRDGLTPLQRQIQLQTERARDLQRQREEQARRGQDLSRAPITQRPAPDVERPQRTRHQTPAPADKQTPLQQRIQENAKRRKSNQEQQIEP